MMTLFSLPARDCLTRSRPTQNLGLRPWHVLLGVVIGALALAHASASAQTSAPAGNARPALSVSVIQPQNKALSERLSASGNIAPWQEAIISSDVDGLRLLEVKAQIADVVQAGQVLARYASDSLLIDLKQAEAGVMEAQANLANVRANTARTKELLDQGFLSAQSAERQGTNEQVAQAQLARAQAALAALQLRLRQSEVRAPDQGVISSSSAVIGAVHGRGVELFRLIRQGRLEWRAEVTAAELARLRPGLSAQIRLADGTAVRGVVRTLAPTVDRQSRTALVYVDLPAMGQSAARAGSFVQGEFTLSQSNALTVPLSALVRREGFAYVYAVEAGDRVKRLKVQTGRLDADAIEITSGLGSDTRIVATGAAFLNDGDRVQVIPSPATNKP